MPVEKVQSKWDLENEVKARATMGSTVKLDEILPTTKVVMWPKVSAFSNNSNNCAHLT